MEQCAALANFDEFNAWADYVTRPTTTITVTYANGPVVSTVTYSNLSDAETQEVTGRYKGLMEADRRQTESQIAASHASYSGSAIPKIPPYLLLSVSDPVLRKGPAAYSAHFSEDEELFPMGDSYDVNVHEAPYASVLLGRPSVTGYKAYAGTITVSFEGFKATAVVSGVVDLLAGQGWFFGKFLPVQYWN